MSGNTDLTISLFDFTDRKLSVFLKHQAQGVVTTNLALWGRALWGRAKWSSNLTDLSAHRTMKASFIPKVRGQFHEMEISDGATSSKLELDTLELVVTNIPGVK